MGMKRSMTMAGRLAKVSSAGGMITGVSKEAWNPEVEHDSEVIVQIGENENSNEIRDAVCKHIGMGEPKKITTIKNSGSGIKSKLVPSKLGSSRMEDSWYDIGGRKDEFPDNWGLLLVNNTDDVVGHSGMMEHIWLLERSGIIAVSNVNFPRQHVLSLRIAQECRGFIRVDEIEMQGGEKVSTAFIEPARAIRTPKPLPYPSIAKILPRRMKIPHPVGVANDYQHISDEVSDSSEGWVPKLRISIVIPLYNRRTMLGRTLAMITHQTYPLDLIEVVIADDGSDDEPISMIEDFQDQLDIQYVRQVDLGYRLAEVRNLGIRSSKHDYVILLDCDMAPVPTMVEEYSRHLEISKRSLFCGHRRYVDANHIPVEDVRESPEPLLGLPDVETVNEKMKRDGHILDWRMPMYRQTDNLRFEKYPFRAVCGGNIGFHKSLFHRAGEFDEAFKAWGKEDTEWGFRVWNRGDYIIPLYEACGLHMEPPGGRNETDRELGLEQVMPTFVDRVPVMYRKNEHGVKHSVPLVSIYIPAFNSEDTIVETVQSALDQTFEDLEICVAVDGSKDGTLRQLEANFLENPRVRWSSQENQGIGGASNTAVQMCRGVFIGQLDSDDVLLPEAVEIMVEGIQKDSRVGLVYGSFQKETPAGEFLEDGYDWPDYSREKLMYGCIVHHFRMFRARDWWRTNGFATDITNAIDFDIYLKLSEVTEVKHVKEWTYVYRIHSKSTSTSQKDIQFRNHYVVINRSLERRGLADQWKIKHKDNPGYKGDFTFEEIKNWDRAKDTTTPFARMESQMKEATPVLISHLAKMEANRKPWSQTNYPEELVRERLSAIVEKKSMGVERKDVEKIAKSYENDLWSAFEQLNSVSEKDDERRGSD
jgi:chondroitin synthase